MSASEPLTVHVGELRGRGHEVEIVQDGSRSYVILQGYRLPDSLYAPEMTDLMVMADYQYPQSRMDMFWTSPTVTLTNGSLPQQADVFEIYAGRTWQRWSWHYPVWDPRIHTIHTHLAVCDDRLQRGV